MVLVRQPPPSFAGLPKCPRGAGQKEVSCAGLRWPRMFWGLLACVHVSCVLTTLRFLGAEYVGQGSGDRHDRFFTTWRAVEVLVCLG